MFQLTDRPQHPDSATAGPANETEQFGLMAGDEKIATLGPIPSERPPEHSMIRNRSWTVGIYLDPMTAPGQFARAPDDAGFGSAQRPALEISPVVAAGLVSEDYVRHHVLKFDQRRFRKFAARIDRRTLRDRTFATAMREPNFAGPQTTFRIRLIAATAYPRLQRHQYR
jgi:hypothetical protein